MKTLKIIGLSFLITGFACVAAALIWAAIDPSEWDAIGPLFVGMFLLAIDLLGLIAFFIHKFVSKRRK